MALNAEFLVKMPVSQKILVLAAAVAVLVLGYWFLIGSSLKSDLERMQAELSQAKSDLAKLETVQKDKEKLDRELKEKERKLEKAKEKLPTETEMERLLLTINELGQQNGIRFSNFKPLAERKEGNLYIEVPIELKFTGGYLYVMNFFAKVAALPRIVNFNGVSITGGGKGKTSEIDVSCTASTYKFIGK
ncbi:MAG TPA: type 4a pilus biogenesis protein PilO [bacterium]|nr:type 4a pilus biogenesis protein PilO [bacterium]